MLKSKKWFMNEWIWKGLCTNQIKTLSVFSLSPHICVLLETLAWSFIKFILWALNKFSIELSRILVQSLESSMYWYHWKIYCSQRTFFYQRFDWQQPGYAKHVADWCCKCKARVFCRSSISDFSHKNSCYETLSRTLLYPNTDHQPVSFLEI